MNEEKKRPIVKCFGREDDVFMFKFWCPFCQKWHYHGYGIGHRSSHCFDSSSPFDSTGYIVKPYTKAELLEIRKIIDWALEYGAHGRTYDKKLKEFEKGRHRRR